MLPRSTTCSARHRTPKPARRLAASRRTESSKLGVKVRCRNSTIPTRRGPAFQSSADGGRIHHRHRRMTEFSFPYVSVASSGGEYFEVSFAEIEEGEESEECDHAYFLIQRQFEDYDGGLFYIESHETKLCGHFKIIGAELARDTFRSEE